MKINNKSVTNISLAGKIVVQIKDILSGQILYKKEDEEEDYFSISPIDGGPAVLTITVPQLGDVFLDTIEYSEDQKTWNTKTLAKGANTIEFNDKLFLRSTIGHLGTSSNGTSHKINVDVPFNAGGNIMSLLYGQDFEDKTSFEEAYPFSFLFYQSNIVNANELSLPATELTNSAYRGMFNGCSSLVTAPDLPATTLGEYCYQNMFYGCTSLTTAPELPATTLADYCYQYMFYGCSKLSSAPVLPATEMKTYCYANMFNKCSSLSDVPALPAMELANACYQNMFTGCSKIFETPTLPATELAPYCYDSMFNGCTSLSFATTLPATTLADGCYQSMFNRCSSLPTAPALPATELAPYCYEYMFSGCSSLIKAPYLPATELKNECYFGMFNACNSLNYIKADFIDDDQSALTTWTQGVAPTGTFIKNPDAIWEYDGIHWNAPFGWTIEVPFYIENISDATAQATFKKTNSAPYLTMSYSTDKGQTWNPIIIANNYSFDIPAHSRIYLDTAVLEENSLKATYDGSKYNYWTIDASTTNAINVGGNLSYLTAHETNMLSGTNGYFYGLFYQSKVNSIGKLILDYDVLGSHTFDSFAMQSNIKEAPKVLPATEMKNHCYANMFKQCTSLVTAPALPATTLANYCYQYMFRQCTSLVTAPALPATTLANYCYDCMFRQCTSLVTAPDLPATTLGEYCYQNMFYGCTSLTTAPELPATTLANDCYDCMFNGCTSLVTAPELPATTLANYCYQYMFNGCTSLVTAPALPATELADYCYDGMFNGCSKLTKAPDLTAAVLTNKCYNSMFSKCTSLVNGPYIQYSTIGSSSLAYMFYNCSKLNNIKVEILNNPGTNATNWMYGVSATGTFYKSIDDFKFTERGVNGIPRGWTIETYYEN